MKKICAANWKLNFSPEEARRYFAEWSALRPANLSCDVLFFTPAYDLTVAAEFAPAEGFHFGPQNIYFETSGAFTGEISARAVHSLGARWALIGHSERRTLFGETDDVIAKKVKTAISSDLAPMLCVGETLAEREAGQTKNIVARQVRAGLGRVVTETASHTLAIAYEPVWAIGTGRVATPQQAGDVHAEIRRILSDLLSPPRAHEIAILYGGSVKPDNAKDLASQPDIDGFLVGGASLKPKDFFAIADAL